MPPANRHTRAKLSDIFDMLALKVIDHFFQKWKGPGTRGALKIQPGVPTIVARPMGVCHSRFAIRTEIHFRM